MRLRTADWWIFDAASLNAPSVVAGVKVAYSHVMVRVVQDGAKSRKASIEAACRIALRMVQSGRGSEASLAFLLSVAARELRGVATIIDEGDADEAECRADSVSSARSWKLPIRARSGKLLGNLRLTGAASGELADEDPQALITVVQTAARIMAARERLVDSTLRRSVP